jgi:hypothetical protein
LQDFGFFFITFATGGSSERTSVYLGVAALEILEFNSRTKNFNEFAMSHGCSGSCSGFSAPTPTASHISSHSESNLPISANAFLWLVFGPAFGFPALFVIGVICNSLYTGITGHLPYQPSPPQIQNSQIQNSQ